MFEGLAASYSSSDGSSSGILVGSTTCSQDDDGNTVCSDGSNSVNLGYNDAALNGTTINATGTVSVQ